jgi:hypothetical protein
MFIQIIQGKTNRQDEVRAHADRWAEELGPTAPGWLGGTYGFTDDGEMIAVVRFESRDAAMKNSQRPEQAEWWSRMEELFDGPVEFHDSDRVVLMMDGGSDQAGFVQIVRGKVDDADWLESGMHEMETLLHEARPEILGATFAIEPDGAFTETVAFTDEAAAREGEKMTPPEAAAEPMKEFEQKVHFEKFMDLHRPWFSSRS